MSLHPSVSSYQVLLSSQDATNSVSNYNNFSVNVLGQLPANMSDFYVKLIASEVGIGTLNTQLDNILSIHVDVGQQSILATNSSASSNFIGLHQAHSDTQTRNVVSGNPALRCSKPQLSQINVQVRNAWNGDLAIPIGANGTYGVIDRVVLMLEFIPIDYLRIAPEIQTYKPMPIR